MAAARSSALRGPVPKQLGDSGKKVIDSIKYNLGLSDHDLRHTESVLRDYGNLSSGSFLFSLERLLQEAEVAEGDYLLMITMGPGSTAETCLGRF